MIDRTQTVDLTPRFNYTRETEIVKRFIEKVLTLADDNHIGSEVLEFVRNPLVSAEVRKSMGLVMSNDIQRQIQIEKNFPLQQQVWFHEFVPYELTDGNFGDRPIPCSECDGMANATVHLFG